MIASTQSRWIIGTVCSLTLVSILWYATITMKPEHRNQAMVRAVGAGNIALVQKYLKEGADPDTIIRYLDEPIESRGYSLHAIRLRIFGGPGAPAMREGQTALVRAVQRNDTQMVQLLIKYGADVNKQDKFGNSALSAALELNAVEISRILEDAQAMR